MRLIDVCVCLSGVMCVTMVIWSLVHRGKYKLLSFVKTQGHPYLWPSDPLHSWSSCLSPLSILSFIPFFQLLLMRFYLILCVLILYFKTSSNATFSRTSLGPHSALCLLSLALGTHPAAVPSALPGGSPGQVMLSFYRLSISTRCVVHWRPQSFK